MILFRNDQFIDLEGNRFIHLCDAKEPAYSYVIRAHDMRAWPLKVETDALRNVRLIGVDVENLEAHRQCSDAELDLAHARWSIIEPLVKDDAILRRGSRWELITERAHEVKNCKNTIASYLKKYWQMGQCIAALVTRRSTSDAQPKDAFRGRKPEGYPGYVLTDDDRRNFEDIIRTVYLASDKVTVSAAYDSLEVRHYKRVDAEGRVLFRDLGQMPTRRQFSHYLRTRYEKEFVLRLRAGPKQFPLVHRPILGSVEQKAKYAGQVYEIDATIIDVTLVFSDDRSRIIGRPTLIYIIEVRTRLIVGWYLGLENASWDAALHAIFSISEDKQKICEALRVDYNEADWPAHQILPVEFHADRGEAMSREATRLSDELSVTVMNLPSCRPDWKPLVEQKFRTTHVAIADLAPGYSPAKDRDARQKSDGSDSAALTLRELQRLILLDIIRHNNSPRDNYRLTVRQISEKFMATPINVWNHEIQTNAGRLARVSEQKLRTALLPRLEAWVTKYGLRQGSLYYVPVDEALHSKFARTGTPTYPVECYAHRNQVDVIHVVIDGRLVAATLAPRSSQYRGLSREETLSFRKAEAQLIKVVRHKQQQERIRFRHESQKTTEPAIALAKLAKKGESKSAGRKNLPADRRIELARERHGAVAENCPVDTTSVQEAITMPSDQPSTSPSAARRLASGLANKARHMKFWSQT